jgi:hypothetical protein
MLLLAGQVITFKGRDGAARAAEFAGELLGRAERIGSTVHIKHRTQLKPVFAAEGIDQFGFDEAAHDRPARNAAHSAAGGNGHREAVRVL